MRLPEAVWLLLDGLSHALLTRLGCGERFPFLQECANAGRIVALRPLSPNCQTPPSLFTIWSGTLPAEHGMTGYDIPCQRGTDPTAFIDGFRDWPRTIPMVWDRYAAAGRTIRTSAIPFMQFEKLGAALLSGTDVFGPTLLRPSIHGAGESLEAPALGLAVSIDADGEGFLLRNRHGPALHIALGQTVSVILGDDAVGGNRAIRCHASCIDGVPKLINLGYQHVGVYGSDARARLGYGQSTGFVASNPGKLYQQGLLGRRLDDGGSGAAETLLVDLLYEVHRSFADDFLWALRAGGAELVVAYDPTVDLLSHQILRHVIDTDNTLLPGPLAPLFERVFGWIDETLAEAAALLPDGTAFIAHSDHGMTPIHRQIAPNRFLREQGLLFQDDSGRIDAARSAMFMHPAENGLLVSDPQRLRTIGTSQEVVLAHLNAVLRAQGVDPIVLVEGPRAPLAPEWACAQYLQAPAGARLRAGPGEPLVSASKKGGDHTVCSEEPWLRGVLIDLGPGSERLAGVEALDLHAILPYLITQQEPL